MPRPSAPGRGGLGALRLLALGGEYALRRLAASGCGLRSRRHRRRHGLWRKHCRRLEASLHARGLARAVYE